VFLRVERRFDQLGKRQPKNQWSDQQPEDQLNKQQENQLSKRQENKFNQHQESQLNRQPVNEKPRLKEQPQSNLNTALTMMKKFLTCMTQPTTQSATKEDFLLLMKVTATCTTNATMELHISKSNYFYKFKS
jgi:hypothetical protein